MYELLRTPGEIDSLQTPRLLLRPLTLDDAPAYWPLVNNAEILMQRRYGRYDEFREKFEKAGGDWERFFQALTREKGVSQ